MGSLEVPIYLQSRSLLRTRSTVGGIVWQYSGRSGEYNNLSLLNPLFLSKTRNDTELPIHFLPKIFVWQRKAQMCGIQMVPIPSDLLALPYTYKSDPLRGPIFIPLDTECLMENKRYLFEGLCS